ncbi:transposase [Bacillus bombysepticus]|uniref:Transposase n=2 Tax=Bacillus thuringiensis TaxID=1428 RepID=A0A9X6PSP3_BACUK|nr:MULTISPECIES: transposase [Bacillus cereus group]EEM55948.1 Transposase IS3/IS911 [Bacillus thuringiensis serovar monterrey BGSC 4AJ1]MBY0015096.1 helix-turn-helix domain containing protein [Bacillus cereus]MEB9673855.1 transposase [Bacillus anthracis]MEC2873299.1 transposase [Bacillus cereus]OTW46215.1 transposase [Bacillus thuringiensis serovar mexicanensis]
MGKIRVNYDVEFKKKAVDLYLKEGMSYKTIAKELGIHHSVVSRWVKHFETEGIKGLEEKSGKAEGPGLGRPRTKPEDPEAKIRRLEAENEMLKKLLGM